jgi:dihydrofolate reductase
MQLLPLYVVDNTNERRIEMGRIIISENVTLDGVIQDPAGNEGFRHGGWIGRIGDRGREEAAQVLLEEALGTEAMLLGRRSYEFLAARWPSRTGELADRLNSKPKYVVSSTLQDPAWNNTTVLKGDAVNEVSKLKQQLAGDIVVAASFQLVQPLLEHDLVDELRLMIYPVVLGTGKRLFGGTSDKKPMRLVGNKTIAGDLVFLTYEPIRKAERASDDASVPN